MSKILIIEDEHAIADIVDFNLKKEGYETAVAYDGGEGLTRCLEENYDLILLDVMLPVMDGWEVLRLLREKKGTPVIMLTAREEELDKVSTTISAPPSGCSVRVRRYGPLSFSFHSSSYRWAIGCPKPFAL